MGSACFMGGGALSYSCLYMLYFCENTYHKRNTAHAQSTQGSTRT